MSRKLTGKWYIKVEEKTKFLNLIKNRDFKIMVEVHISNPFNFFPNTDFTQWQKATDSDIIELGISIL